MEHNVNARNAAIVLYTCGRWSRMARMRNHCRNTKKKRRREAREKKLGETKRWGNIKWWRLLHNNENVRRKSRTQIRDSQCQGHLYAQPVRTQRHNSRLRSLAVPHRITRIPAAAYLRGASHGQGRGNSAKRMKRSKWVELKKRSRSRNLRQNNPSCCAFVEAFGFDISPIDEYRRSAVNCHRIMYTRNAHGSTSQPVHSITIGAGSCKCNLIDQLSFLSCKMWARGTFSNEPELWCDKRKIMS